MRHRIAALSLALVALAAGGAEVALASSVPADIAFFALDTKRLTAGTEVHLLTLLHSRAEAHKL